MKFQRRDHARRNEDADILEKMQLAEKDSLGVEESWFRRRATMRDAGLFLFISVRTTGCCRWADFFYGDELQLVSISINAQQGPIVTQMKRFEDLRVFFWMLSSVCGRR